jgi:hypothetical protein
MPAFSLEVEYSKSNRAACKCCKAKIDKDVVRVGVKVVAEEGAESNHMLEAVKWYHFACLPRFKGAAWFKKQFPGNAADTFAGFGALKPEDQTLVEELLSACRGQGPVPSLPEAAAAADALPTPVKGTRGKRKSADGVGEDTAGKAAKVNHGPTADQAEAIAAAKTALSSKNIAMLGALLAKNGLPKSGRKDELVERVAECQVLGVPPTCPTCEKVKLKFSNGTGKFSCAGYFDDEEKMFKRCKGPADAAAVLERTPWQESLI